MKNGKEFEADVLHLLKLQGWRVKGEQLVGHKRIDAYAERQGDFAQLKRAAIECKSYSQPMGPKQLTGVYSDYLPLLQQGLVDEIVLITKSGVTPAGEAFAKKAQGFVHLTYAELLNSLMDFSRHLQGVIAQFESDDVRYYYVKQTMSRSRTGSTADNQSEEAEDFLMD